MWNMSFFTAFNVNLDDYFIDAMPHDFIFLKIECHVSCLGIISLGHVSLHLLFIGVAFDH